jgi:Uncharacterized conserved protein (DUF2285)/Family of unknown function (DUF6499)
MPQVRLSGTAWERRLEDYAYTVGLDRPGWAWEFLRRNEHYGRDFEVHATTLPMMTHAIDIVVFTQTSRDETAEKWGLAALTNPKQDAQAAPLFWLPSHMHSNVQCHAKLANENHKHTVNHSQFRGRKFVLLTSGEEYLVIRDHHTTVRLLITGKSILTGDCVFSFSFDGIENAVSRLQALRDLQQLMSFSPKHSAPIGLSNCKYRDYLVALDGHLAHRTYRDIAEVLYGSERVKDLWTNETRHLKDKVRRAVQAGIELMNGGYVNLLN